MKKYFLVRKLSIISLVILSIFLFTLCSKDEGDGGTSSIKGKVFGKYYNKTFTTFMGSAYVPEKDVYIIYGDNASYGDRIRTNYDGTFEFKYLRKGDYKVYVYSKDSTLTLPSGVYAVLKAVTIKENAEVVEVSDLITFE